MRCASGVHRTYLFYKPIITEIKMDAIKNVKELESKKVTFVKFADVCKFMGLCHVLGIVASGGAFDAEMTGQWFYL